jgi:cation diffusion facilitator family transporter
MAAWERIAARVALVGMGTSAVLAAVKIAVGLKAHSIAVVSDGMESGADFVTSSLVWLGLWIAAKPADRDHPYGHGRFEILIGLAIGALLWVVGAGICLRSIEERNDNHVPAVFAVWAMAASIAVHGLMAAVKMRIGRRAGSVALTADAWHDLVDLFSGCVALVAVLLSVFVSGMRAADHYGGFAIGLIVIFLGLRVARETTLQLMDTMPDDEQMQQIRAVAANVPGALAIEKCFARKTGLRYHVDLHLEVDPHLTVLESHQIAHEVQFRITTDLDWVADVLVHVEPHFAVRPADWPAAKIEQ